MALAKKNPDWCCQRIAYHLEKTAKVFIEKTKVAEIMKANKQCHLEDYNFNRPNQGNGGFAPNSVHHTGQKELTEQRNRTRQKIQELRRKHWEQESTYLQTVH